LLAEDTRDEAYFWKARNDQKRMETELQNLKSFAGELSAKLEQSGLEDYTGGTEQATKDESSATNGEDGDGTDTASDSDKDENATAASGQGDSTGDDQENEEGDGQADLTAFAGESGGRETEDPRETDEPTETGEPPKESPPDSTKRDGVPPSAGTESDAIEIVVDQRELDSTIARDLSTRDGIETRLETLAVGDYVLSDRAVVERKTVSDFLDTLTGGDRSMFEQVGDAARSYGRPVVIIEGGDLYGQRNIHEKAINGALASLSVDFGASVLRTGNESETADLLETIASREQDDGNREVSVHGEKQSKTLGEQQEYVVTSVAEVGPVTARNLLEYFGTVEAVMTATDEELQAVDGIGEVTADRIRAVVGSAYEG
jgi:Fanconi anemia group M protein